MTKKCRAFSILMICSFFLFFKYITQLFPSLINTSLMDQFKLSGVQIGIMAASYYYSYTFMQIIAGVLLDKFDVKLPAFFAIFIIAIALIGFAHTDNFFYMCLYRALMGVGCSFATILYMKSAASWTSAKTFAFISSLLATATMLGAAVGAAPIGFLFASTGWQTGLLITGIFGIVLALLAIIFVASFQETERQSTMSFKDFKDVITNRANIWLLLYSGITFSPIIILGGVWGCPFLELKFNMSAKAVSTLISIMFVGHAIGSPFWALLSSLLNNKKNLMVFANLIAFVSLVFIIYGPLSYFQAGALFFIFGFCVGCFMLSFNICREINPVLVMGFAVAFINTGEGIVGSILEPGIGLILDYLKTEGNEFSLANYQYGLFILPICYILSTWIISKLSFRTHDNVEIELSKSKSYMI